MDRERAEAFLRLLAEAELRRIMARPADRAVLAGGISRVMRVAGALTTVGVFGEEVTGPVLDDFESALGRRGVRTPGHYGRDLRTLLRSGPSHQTPGAPDVAVPVGQVIPVHGDDVTGEVVLLSYALTESGALLTFVARPGQVMIPYRQFTAAGNQGASYQASYNGSGRRPGVWTLRLYPPPPRDLRWLNLSTTPGEPAARIDLIPRTPPGPPAPAVSPAALTPAEQLLNNMALRLLATGGIFPQFILILLTEMALERPGPLPGTADGLGDVIAALQVCGALPAHSPVPGQLAVLCTRLNVTGHGLAAPPARDLPEPWLSVLTHDQRAAPPGEQACAAVAAALPDLDGTRLSILGLTSSPVGTVLHIHASGEARRGYFGWPENNLAPAIWIRDSRGHWHATRVEEYHEGDLAMHLEVVPPLSPGTAWIEVLAAGPSAEVRVTLPLRWQ